MRIISYITTSSYTSYEYMNKSSFSSLPKQNSLTFCSGVVSNSCFSLKYWVFSSLTDYLFETVMTWSPAVDRILIYPPSMRLNRTYSNFAFIGDFLSFQLVQLIILVVALRIINARNRNPVVDPCLIYCRGQTILRQLQLCRLN